MRVKITIDVKHGSKFQQELFDGAIGVMLKALKIHHELAHKKNKVDYSIDWRENED